MRRRKFRAEIYTRAEKIKEWEMAFKVVIVISIKKWL